MAQLAARVQISRIAVRFSCMINRTAPLKSEFTFLAIFPGSHLFWIFYRLSTIYVLLNKTY